MSSVVVGDLTLTPFEQRFLVLVHYQDRSPFGRAGELHLTNSLFRVPGSLLPPDRPGQERAPEFEPDGEDAASTDTFWLPIPGVNVSRNVDTVTGETDTEISPRHDIVFVGYITDHWASALSSRRRG